MTTPYRPRIDVQHVLERGEIAGAFYRSEAQAYIGKISVYENSKLDIVATAGKVPIPIVYDSAMMGAGRYTPRISPFSDDPKPRINLLPDLPDKELTFAHELGHHFLDDVLNIGFNLVGSLDEPISEAFCEFFGHKMSREEPLDDVELEVLVKDKYEIPADYGAYILEKIMEQPPRW